MAIPRKVSTHTLFSLNSSKETGGFMSTRQPKSSSRKSVRFRTDEQN